MSSQPTNHRPHRYIVEEADRFSYTDEFFWPSGSVNSPLITNDNRDASCEQEETGHRSSFGLSIFNLMNAILGSGVLGLSYAMAESGIVLFIFLLATVALMADYSIHLLLKMCVLTGVKSYEEIGLFAFRVPGKLVAASAILLQNVGAMSSYLFIVKDELPSILGTFLEIKEPESLWYLNGTYLLLVVVFVVIVPLACLPKIGFLGYTSGLSVICMVFFTVVVVIKKFLLPCPVPVAWKNETLAANGHQTSILEQAANHSISSECQPKYFSLTVDTAYALPMMAFSFVCHTAVLPVYCELAKPSKWRMQHVANTSILLSFTIYTVSALFGYLTFYGNVSSELLDGYRLYDDTDVLILSVRVAVCLAIIFTIPLIHYPARKSLLMILNTWLPITDASYPWLRHVAATAILITMVMSLAIFVPSLKEIFGIVGATASICLVFILPAAFYLRLGVEPLLSTPKAACVLLILVGVATLVVSLTTIIYSMISA